MTLQVLKREYKKKMKETGYTVSYPRNMTGIRLETQTNFNSEFSVTSEGDIREEELVLRPLHFDSHGSYQDYQLMKGILDFWFEYCKIHGIQRIVYEEFLYGKNQHGGWGNEERIAAALSYGFQIEESFVGRNGKIDAYRLVVNIKDSQFYISMINKIENCILVQVQKDSSFLTKPFRTIECRETNLPSFLVLNLIWEGFNGYIAFYKYKDVCWFQLIDDDNHRPGSYVLQKYLFTPDNYEQVFSSALEELVEYQKMINLISPPSHNLLRFLSNYNSNFNKEDAEDIMRMFMEKGLSYNEVESEMIHLLNSGTASPRGIIQKFDVFTHDTELVIKVLNFYLVLFKPIEVNKKEILTFNVVQTKEEIIQYYCRYLTNMIDKNFVNA